jgi:hypothetical protein
MVPDGIKKFWNFKNVSTMYETKKYASGRD